MVKSKIKHEMANEQIVSKAELDLVEVSANSPMREKPDQDE